MDVHEAWKDLAWRIEHDRITRGQFVPVDASSEYFCECVCDERHLREEVAAEWMRPPIPELRAKNPFYVCGECLLMHPEA